MDVFVLLCIPGFILAGDLMNGGGVTERIIRFAQALVGWIRGGLAQTNIAGSMLFGGIFGAAVADAASTVGPIIPPSAPMIIVGALSGISVGKMFLAGAIPGLLTGAGMMVATGLIARRRNLPRQPWAGFRELFRAFLGVFWALAMTGLIIGGLLSGVATPTEIAIVASLYAFVFGCFVYRGLPLKIAPKVLADSAISSAAILALVGFANVFGWILVSERIPQALAQGVGVEPLHFATFAVLNLMIGLREPIILGHEAAGTVEALGDDVEGPAPGTRVAINPSRPCGACAQCRAGRPIHCLEMRFNGSILRFPHVQGLFRERIVVDAAQCVPVARASLAVCLHAAPALAACIASVRPEGAVVQVGVGGATPIPLNALVGKEISLRGTHRFHAEFNDAAIDAGALDVTPLITASFPLAEAVRAFELASDRAQASKVQISFD